MVVSAATAWAGVSNAASITNLTSFGGELFSLTKDFAKDWAVASDDAKAMSQAVKDLTSILAELPSATDANVPASPLAIEENEKFRSVLMECQEAFNQVLDLVRQYPSLSTSTSQQVQWAAKGKMEFVRIVVDIERLKSTLALKLGFMQRIRTIQVDERHDQSHQLLLGLTEALRGTEIRNGVPASGVQDTNTDAQTNTSTAVQENNSDTAIAELRTLLLDIKDLLLITPSNGIERWIQSVATYAESVVDSSTEHIRTTESISACSRPATPKRPDSQDDRKAVDDYNPDTIYYCWFKGCDRELNNPFKRKEDRNSHIYRVHGSVSPNFYCPYQGCYRAKGAEPDNPFKRKERLRSHIFRRHGFYYNEDVLVQSG